MSKGTVKLTLTHKEAFALRMAAGNTMEYPDAIESIFEGHREREAAERAWLKLLEACGERGDP